VNQTLIRQAEGSDTQAISRLQQQWFEEGSVYGFVPESREQVEAAISPYLLVAEVGNQVIGFISGSARISDGTAVIPEGESYLEIDNLYVAPEFRRRGVGSRLITQLLARAKQRDVAYAVLYSAAKDIHSILRFYERHSFQSWYVRMFRKL
jgi:ribosomal protein S18 acetylase RimI-like enzyme